MIIELQSLSPDSTYKFNKDNTYVLALINTSANNNTYIYKHKINNLNNINKDRKTYQIKASFRPTSSLSLFNKTNYSVKLFEQTPNNSLNLLFSGKLDLENLIPGTPTNIKLQKPSRLKNTNYSDNTSFLEEQFYNINTYSPRSNNKLNACYLFLKLVPSSPYILIKPTILNTNSIQSQNEGLYLYHRYSNKIIKELVPTSITSNTSGSTTEQLNAHYRSFIDAFCNTDASYQDYLKVYQRDNIFPTHNSSSSSSIKKLNFHQLISQQINHEFRPIMSQPNSNTMMTAPADCRIRGFNINSTLKIKAYNSTYDLSELVDDPKLLQGGSGFMCRISPQDYQRVHTPYEASIKKIVLDDNIISLKFKSEYFLPDSTQSRDLAAVLWGNYLHTSTGGRTYPELMATQPDSTLIYYVVIISLNHDTSMRLTNKKLLTLNSNNKIKANWFEQGEELGKLICGNAYVLVLCNRPMVFTKDISYFSKMIPSNLSQPLDTFVQLRDKVGVLL